MDLDLDLVSVTVLDLDPDDWIIVKGNVKPLTIADMEANRIIAMGWDDMLRYCPKYVTVSDPEL